jgi:hypothetical protein
MLAPDANVSSTARIAERFGVSVTTVINAWARHDRFPRPVGEARRNRVYPDPLVEAWVRENRPVVWAAYQQGDQPYRSGENPDELLDMREFARLRAERVGGEPAADVAMHSYINRGVIPKPDRKPGDGREPDVSRIMWKRSTVDRHLDESRGRGNYGRGSRGPASESAQGEAEPGPTPAKKTTAAKAAKKTTAGKAAKK